MVDAVLSAMIETQYSCAASAVWIARMSFLEASEATRESRLDLDNATGSLSGVSEQAAPILKTHWSTTS